MRKFDNRSIRGRLLFPFRIKNSEQFLLPVGKEIILYSYIRKNGCSSVKSFCKGEFLAEDKKPIVEQLHKYHRAKNIMDIAKINKAFFIYRHPVDRAASLFRNKFIQKSGHEDIKRNFEKLTLSRFEDCNFRFFVEAYLSQDFEKLDSHTFPQINHLLPIKYDLAIPLDKLHEGMTTLIGRDLADQYFLSRENTSRSIEADDQRDVSEIPAKELSEKFAKQGILPTTEALSNANLNATIEKIYYSDFKLPLNPSYSPDRL